MKPWQFVSHLHAIYCLTLKLKTSERLEDILDDRESICMKDLLCGRSVPLVIKAVIGGWGVNGWVSKIAIPAVVLCFLVILFNLC